MKKSILLLSLFLVGNAAHAGIASKMARCGTLLLPAMFLEGSRIYSARTDMKDIKDSLDRIHKIMPAFHADSRPYGNAEVFVDDRFKQKPDLYDALKAHEEAHIAYYHRQKNNLFAAISPFAFYSVTTPLAKIPNRIARASRPIVTFGLWLGSLAALMRHNEKEADLAIQDPEQIKAFIQFLDERKKNHPKTGWFNIHPCPEDRIKYLNDHLANIKSKQI